MHDSTELRAIVEPRLQAVRLSWLAPCRLRLLLLLFLSPFATSEMSDLAYGWQSVPCWQWRTLPTSESATECLIRSPMLLGKMTSTVSAGRFPAVSPYSAWWISIVGTVCLDVRVGLVGGRFSRN